MATAKKKAGKELESLVIRHEAALDQGKAAYRQADELAAAILGQLNPKQPLALSDGRTLRIKDNFAGGNKAWKPCGINRYEIEITRS